MKKPANRWMAALLVCLSGGAALAQTWKSDAPSGLWETPTNWVGDVAPAEPALAQVVFARNRSTAITISVNSNKTLKAGMYFGNMPTNVGTDTFNLNGNTLTLSGSSMILSADTIGGGTYVVFSNGTVQLGDANGATALTLGGSDTSGSSTGAISMRFDADSILNTANTSSISVAAVGSYNNYLTLDLSAATLNSGALEKTLAVTGSIAIGQWLSASPSDNRMKNGLMKLGVVSDMVVGQDLVVGQSARTSTSLSSAQGTLEFSASPQQEAANLRIGRSLRIGVGAGGIGTITNIPDELNLSIGDDEARGASSILVTRMFRRLRPAATRRVASSRTAGVCPPTSPNSASGETITLQETPPAPSISGTRRLAFWTSAAMPSSARGSMDGARPGFRVARPLR